MTFHPTKRAAIKEIKDNGFVPGQRKNDIAESLGESGDHGYGSRIYFQKLDGGYNDYGFALVHATASKVGREWATSYFGVKK